MTELLDYLNDPEENIAASDIIHGVVPAQVTNIKDPETLGRIKVKFPWLSDNNETDWIRMTSFMGGNQRGAVFFPEVDDEVLVSFEHGDINAPYVIGVLWNNTDKIPETNSDGKNNIKLIKSRCGHTITIDDNDQGAKIEIKTNAGHTLTMDDKSGSEKIELKDKTGSNKITFTSSSNTIAIESAMELKIKAVNVTIEASGNLQMKGAQVKVEASAMMDLNSSGIANLKGSLVKIN